MNRGIGMLSMDGRKLLHLVRLFLIAISVGGLLFWMGWIMGKQHYEKMALDALNNNDTVAAVKVLRQWQENSSDAINSPMFFLTCARRFAELGDMEGVKYNLDKMAKLVGK